jgi:hypothetical protein
MKFSRFVLRGVLGGVAGGLIFLIGDSLHDKLRMGYVPYGGAYQVMALPYFVILGIVIGAIIGCIVWALIIKANINLSAIQSFLVGASFIVLLGMLFYLFGNDENNGLIPPTQMEELVTGLMYVTFLGALPGLLAYPWKRRTARVDRDT